MFEKIKNHLKKPLEESILGLFILITVLVVGPYLLFASFTIWSQTDWSGGDGQADWSDVTKFSSQTNIDITTPGEIKLASLGGGGGGDTWERYLGASGYYYSVFDVVPTNDGGYVMLAGRSETGSWGVGDQDAIVVKLDSSFNITWNYLFDGGVLYDDNAISIKQTEDDGYVVAGYSCHSDGFGCPISDQYIWILKLDSDGAIIWEKDYKNGDNSYVSAVELADDGGYLVGGYSAPGGVDFDLWLLRLDSAGDIVWQKTYGETESDYLNAITKTDDGGYLIAAETYSFGANDATWIFKIDDLGDVQWEKLYDEALGGAPSAIEEFADNSGFLVSAYGSAKKIDLTGNVVWEKKSELAWKTKQVGGGFVGIQDYNSGIGIALFDSSFNPVWEKNYHPTSGDWANFIFPATGGGYIVFGGSSALGGPGLSNILILKISADGTIDDACSVPDDLSLTPTDGTPTESSPVAVVADAGGVTVVESLSSSIPIISNTNICSAFSQFDWSGGPGQANWLDETMFDTSTDVDYGTANSVILGPNSVAPETWIKTYGYPITTIGEDSFGNEIAYFAEQTADDGYIVVGKTDYSTNDDILILKLDSSNAIEWQKTYGGASDEIARAVQQTDDDGYVVVSSVGGDFWVLKLDSVGDIVWQKTYGDVGEEEARFIQQTDDGGYVVTGSTDSFGAGGNDIWIIKLDSVGDVTWQKTYGDVGGEDGYSIQQTSDGGYVVLGSVPGDVWILKLDSAGDVTWQKTYGGGGSDWVRSIRETSDGGYIIAGDSVSFTVFDYAWIFKIDSVGVIEWEKTYGDPGNNLAMFAQETSDGGYIFTGQTNSLAWIVKLFSDGTVDWQKTYGDGIAYFVQETSDNGYFASGFINTGNGVGDGGDEMLVLKLDSAGLADSSCSVVSDSVVVPADSTAVSADTVILPANSGVVPVDSAIVSVDSDVDFANICPIANYIASGTLTSSIYDFLSPVTWGPFSYSGTEPAGTSFDFWVSIDGGAIWTAVTDFITQTFGPSDTVAYRVQLNTTDSAVTPTLTSVSLSADDGGGGGGYESSGVLTSSVYDSENPKTIWGPITYNATTPADTNVSIEVSTDGGGSWEAVTDFVNQTFGPAQTFQYRVTLETTDSVVTPTFSEISISQEVGSESSGGRVTPTCIPPQVLVDNVCKNPTPIIPDCVYPQTLVNNVCITPAREPTPKPLEKPAPEIVPTPVPVNPPATEIAPVQPTKDKNPTEIVRPALDDNFDLLPPLRDFVDDPVVKTVRDIAVVLSLVFSLLALANSVMSGTPLLNHTFYSSVVALQFLGFVKKSKPWGVVYDSVTKRPIPHARVEILNEQSRKLQSTIADENGRYSFLISRHLANVQLRAYRTKYIFPSKEEPSLIERKMYPNIYKGGLVNALNNLTNFDLPMDPISKTPARSYYFGISSIKLNNTLTSTANVLFVLGAVLGLTNVIVNPGALSFALLAAVIFTFLLRTSGFKLKPFGLTKDIHTDRALPFGFVALHYKNGERINFTVSDEVGRYFLLAPKGNYLLKAVTPSHVSPTRTNEVPISTSKGWISEEVKV